MFKCLFYSVIVMDALQKQTIYYKYNHCLILCPAENLLNKKWYSDENIQKSPLVEIS